MLVRPDHKPCAARRLAPTPAAPVDAPPPVHPQMRVNGEVALEADEQMLALGVHGADGPSLQPLRPAIAAEARVRSLDRRDLLADQRGPDTSRGPIDRVALGHQALSVRR